MGQERWALLECYLKRTKLTLFSMLLPMKETLCLWIGALGLLVILKQRLCLASKRKKSKLNAFESIMGLSEIFGQFLNFRDHHFLTIFYLLFMTLTFVSGKLVFDTESQFLDLHIHKEQ
jgi:hypothetical protein